MESSNPQSLDSIDQISKEWFPLKGIDFLLEVQSWDGQCGLITGSVFICRIQGKVKLKSLECRFKWKIKRSRLGSAYMFPTLIYF